VGGSPAINRAINLAIVPVRNKLGLAGKEWNICPDLGDCSDFAVSKRHALFRRGWPARTLLLSEVAINSGEHQLVLLVRTRSGDLVLDNFKSQIKSWSQVPYRWARVQNAQRQPAVDERRGSSPCLWANCRQLRTRREP
jgi:predicted transglutaminase-like cysteine proteinase